MSVIYQVPVQYLKKGLLLDPELSDWLKERSEHQFFVDVKYGALLEIEDELVALQFKLIFDL
jgi:hypothetical protein